MARWGAVPAIRILEKLRGMGFDKGYSIVKGYVSSRKMDKEIPNHNASSGETAAETGGRQA